MRRVLVIGPNKESERVIDTLYNAGTIHLEDVTEKLSKKNISLLKWEPENRDELSALLAKASGILRTLPATDTEVAAEDKRYEELYWQTHKELIEQTRKTIESLESVTRELSNKKSDLHLSINALNRYKKIIERIQPLEEQLPYLEGFEVTVLLIQKEFEDIIPVIRNELMNITNRQCEMISAPIDDDTIAAITVFNKHYYDQVHAFIFSKNVNEVRLPAEYTGKPFDEVLDLIDKKIAKNDEELLKTKAELAGLSNTWRLELSALNSVLADKNKEMDEFSKFARTGYTFMVMGWMPDSYIEPTKKAISKEFGGTVILLELSLTREDYQQAPTHYKNPKVVRPFEFLMKLVRPPKYMEIDPSPLLAIFFPLFFGLMVGDIGYGLVILAFALVVKKRFGEKEWVSSLMNVMIISSIPTIFFGYLFGEFFGDFGEHMEWFHPIHFMGIEWNRVDAMFPLLILAIVLGVIHVSIGLCLGILNAYTAGKWRHIAEKIGMLSLIAGLILILITAAGLISETLLIPGFIVVIISLALIIYGGGARGTIEIMGTIGNILSYARIMAIGMASVILALVANALGGSIGVAIIGIFAASMLHVLNIILAMFSPSLHSIRLHIVECYSKFYEGGGTFYRPFGRKGTLR